MRALLLVLIALGAAAAAYWFQTRKPSPVVEVPRPADAPSEPVVPVMIEETGPGYFESPQAAVTEATKLMKSKSWKQLSRYYDLDGSGVARSTLDSGVYFMTKVSDTPQPPPMGQLGDREPFPPGFQFVTMEPDKEPGVTLVTLGLEIDQGGGPKQKVMRQVRMKKHEQGWQFVPPAAPKTAP